VSFFFAGKIKQEMYHLAGIFEMKNGVCTTFFYMQVLVNQMKVYGSESAVITLSFASSPELTLSTADPEEGNIASGVCCFSNLPPQLSSM